MNHEKFLDGADRKTIIGKTAIYVCRKRRKIIISHAGDADDTELTLKKRIDKVFGDGTWNSLHEVAKTVKTEGYIPRLYTETLQF